MRVNVFHITPAPGALGPAPAILVDTVLKWRLSVPDIAVCLWLPANLGVFHDFMPVPAVRVSELPPAIGLLGGFDMGPARNVMDNILLEGRASRDKGFTPPKGFVGCIGPETLLNLGEFTNDSLFNEPPPLLRQMAQMGGGL
jgi:hypothetical protein